MKLCTCVHVDLCRRHRRNIATLELLTCQTGLEIKSRFSKISRKYVPWSDCAWFLPMHAVFYLVTIIFRLIQCTCCTWIHLICLHTYSHIHEYTNNVLLILYSGTSLLLWTPLGPQDLSQLQRCALFQKLIFFTLFYVAGTNKTSVLIREVSLFRGSLIEWFHCSNRTVSMVPGYEICWYSVSAGCVLF